MTATEPPLRAAIIPVTPLQQNCSLLWCSKTMRGAFVDPGGDLPRLKAAAEQTGVTIEKILLTHGHIDHCGSAGIFAEELGAPIEGPHEDDIFWIEKLGVEGPKYGIDGRPFEPSRWLNDGDQVTVGELTFNVAHCPGHTPGHIVFHHPESKLALVGDVLFKGSVGRWDFPRGNQEQLINSITTKLWPMGDDTAFVPGHGPMSTFGHERRSNPMWVTQPWPPKPRETMAKVHIDISLFTREAAFGMISGPLEIEVIPQVDDQIAFRLSRPVEAYRGELPFGGQLRVTNRIIGAKAEDGIILVLEDLTGATTEDARQLLEMFEKDYGLFGDVWEQ